LKRGEGLLHACISSLYVEQEGELYMQMRYYVNIYMKFKVKLNLSWRAHIVNIFEKVNKKLNMLKGLNIKLAEVLCVGYINHLFVLSWDMQMYCGTVALKAKATFLNM
jgi:hypothetical protein